MVNLIFAGWSVVLLSMWFFPLEMTQFFVMLIGGMVVISPGVVLAWWNLRQSNAA